MLATDRVPYYTPRGGTTSERFFAAGTPSLLRAINERTVLELIHRLGGASRAQVARESGLSKPTVSLVLEGLLDAGLVLEVGRTRGRKGPGAVLYRVNRDAGWVAGIDVGRNWLRAAVADITGAVVARRDERARGRSAGALIAQIGALAHAVAGDAGIGWERVTCACVGSSGVVDPTRARLAYAPNLPGSSRPGLPELIAAELGTAVSFENDVNLAALGEREHGCARGVDTFAYLWVGTGVGLGLVLEGRLYRGATGAAGEIGYLPLAGDPGDPANRRRGTLEEAAGAAGVVRAARELGMAGRLTAERVFEAARRGDPVAGRVVELEARRLALAIAALAPVLDPALVVLGGGIAGSAGDLLAGPIARELARISPFRPRIEVTQLGNDAVLHGALATALAEAQRRVFTRSRNAELVAVAV